MNTVKESNKVVQYKGFAMQPRANMPWTSMTVTPSNGESNIQ